MQKDIVYLGLTPVAEESARIGQPDYEKRASREGLAYIEAIRKTCGPEPEGAKLRLDREEGGVIEVVCEYDPDNKIAAGYAQRCSEQAPTSWEAVGMSAPGTTRDPGTGKRYVGERTPDGVSVVVLPRYEEPYLLDPRFDLRNHSPDGFNFGYGGSGPAQLSLALLADALGDDAKATRHYQDYKFKVIGRLSGDRFELRQEDIQQKVAELEEGRDRKLS